jgi:hypothetical protein
MENEQPKESNDEMSATETDWESRTLCSDGNCIGVIGSDGCCKECGKPYDGQAIDDEAIEDDAFEDDAFEDDAFEDDAFEDDAFEDDAYDHDEDYDEEDAMGDSDASEDLNWESRKLCSDGNCIGVIGPDGRCKECGKRFKG